MQNKVESHETSSTRDSARLHYLDWLRGYGDPPPQTLIVLGIGSMAIESSFQSCSFAGQITNRYGIKNEETKDHPTILLCRGLRRPWLDFWKSLQRFG